MPLSQCARCQKIFDKGRSPVCPKCQTDEDLDYDKIRAVLDKFPTLNAEQTAVEAGVDVQCVLRMLEEGLIANISQSDVIKCGRCGSPAISKNKKLCQACLEKLNAQAASAQSKIKLRIKKDVQVGEYLNVQKTYEMKKR